MSPGTASGPARAGSSSSLNAALRLGLDTARSELIDAASGQIRFFPDGSSTGGRITLTMQAQQAQVTVDWLTGQIAIADVGS